MRRSFDDIPTSFKMFEADLIIFQNILKMKQRNIKNVLIKY